jgi:hypothetical protein
VDRHDLASPTGAVAAFLEVLRETGAALDARSLKQRLVARGIDPKVVDAAWRRAQPAVRRHEAVSFDAVRGTYRFGDAVPAPALTPEEALERLLPARLTTRAAEFAGVVRAALKEREDLELRLRSAYVDGRAAQAARERQAQVNAVRALAAVVSEVEELAVAGAGGGVLAERARALALVFGLVAVGRAGERTAYDPARHESIGTRPADGEWVTVVRPGYAWIADGDELLLHRAQVAWTSRV